METLEIFDSIKAFCMERMEIADLCLNNCDVVDQINSEESSRVFAGTFCAKHSKDNKMTICISKKFDDLPEECKFGILLHEVGHIGFGLFRYGDIDFEAWASENWDEVENEADFFMLDHFKIEIDFKNLDEEKGLVDIEFVKNEAIDRIKNKIQLPETASEEEE